jgi:hypothetical protein
MRGAQVRTWPNCFDGLMNGRARIVWRDGFRALPALLGRRRLSEDEYYKGIALDETGTAGGRA